MLETERLILKPFKLDDLDALIELRSDDEVVKYLGGELAKTREWNEQRLKFYVGCHEKFGYGMCAMHWKQTSELIGWSGLQPLEKTGEVEVGYGMVKHFWRRGIGFECAQAWLKYGFEKLSLEKIVAVTYPENAGSRRVMEKCGMSFEKMEQHYGVECAYYAISREAFRAGDFR
jgi:RimJ/RimL family protein N-acetyltransferase